MFEETEDCKDTSFSGQEFDDMTPGGTAESVHEYQVSWCNIIIPYTVQCLMI